MRENRVCPLPNTPFANINYFKLAIFKKQESQKEPVTLLLCLPKGIQIETPTLEREPYHIHFSTYELIVASGRI